MTDASIDPRVLLATMLVGLTVSGAQKIMALIHENKDDDAELAAIVAETDARLARRA